ncbi:MAG: hypothetical protein ACFFG0_04610 [Candidatus Thorarchaeota archaeon]
MAKTVKLTDGGANTITFSPDTYNERDIDLDLYNTTADGSLRQYTIGNKKEFTLSVKNIENSDYSTLKTIYDLRTTLQFFRDSAAAKTADVFWTGDFEIHTPTEESRVFVATIYQGTIVLRQT